MLMIYCNNNSVTIYEANTILAIAYSVSNVEIPNNIWNRLDDTQQHTIIAYLYGE